MSVKVNCSSCGGDVEVASKASRVAACPYCKTTLIVNEAAIHALGEMALLAETPSCLAVGWTAKCLKRDIRVLGRLQYQYDSGLWDEWWVQFVDDGTYAWISQDEANYILEMALPDGLNVPDFDAVVPGDTIEFAKQRLLVKEKNVATMVGVQGELPLDAGPQKPMRYLDLVGKGIHATVEYFDDGTHRAYQGRRLKPNDLVSNVPGQVERQPLKSAYPPPVQSSPANAKQIIKSASHVQPQSVTCPSCGGSIQLIDEQGTAMVVCRHCGSALDVSVFGKVQLLYQADQKQRHFPLKIGARGKLKGVEYTVNGLLSYSQREDGVTYTWTSFQMYNPEKGYAFLELENGHWMLFKSIEHPAKFDPRYASPKQSVTYQGQAYKVFERSSGRVSYVEGELSWVARIDDIVRYMDAIRPPYLLSAEWTENEIEWSMGVYVTADEVGNAFQLPENQRTRPRGVSPAQPFLRTKGQSRRTLAGFIAVAVLFGLMIGALTKQGSLVFQSRNIPSSAYLADDGYTTEPFSIPEGTHICKLRVEGNHLDNSWVSISVAFVDDQENVLLDTDATVERYSGYEGGESWSEGASSRTRLVRLEGPKTYQMVVFGETGTWSTASGDRVTQSGSSVSVELHRGVVPLRYFVMAMLLTAIYPVKESLRKGFFEMQRWPSDD